MINMYVWADLYCLLSRGGWGKLLGAITESLILHLKFLNSGTKYRLQISNIIIHVMYLSGRIYIPLNGIRVK